VRNDIYMKAKLLISIIVLGIGLMACNSMSEKEKLQKELDKKKLEYSDLKLEINELQNKLESIDTTTRERGIAVNTDKLEMVTFKHFFDVNSSFEAVNYAYISPETSGQLKHILVKEGDHVKKGQLLAKLNTAIIENSIAEIKTALSLSKTIYKKQKELWDKNIGSELDYLRSKTEMESMENKLKTLQSQLEMSLIKSPIDGVVDQINIREGELAMPGQLMMQIINLKEFYLNAEVSESYLPYLHQGDMAEIRLLSYDDLIMQAPIYRISNIINKENRSFKVQMKVENTRGIIKPNMLAIARFKDFESDAAIVVPSIIVKKDFTGNYLFIVEHKDGKAYAHKVYVEIGRSKDDQTMIVSGLKAGDEIIINGYNQVVEGSLVSIQ